MADFQFNRVLVKLSEEELEDRRSRFLKEGEEIDVNLICYPEEKVVKAFERADVPDDNWPVFEYVNVTAEGPGGKHANLLLSARDGKSFVVKGEVHVDKDFKNRLVSYRRKPYKNLNGSMIQLQNVDNVSIGLEPITIWISSDAGWFEVKPAAEYRPTYEKMLHVIGIFFLAIEDFEGRFNEGETYQATTVPHDVQRIFEKYMLIDGSGVTRLELVTACQESRSYLLEQFRKKLRNEYWVAQSPGIVWTDCNFYRWVFGGCPTDPPDKMEHDSKLAKMLPPPGNSSALKKSAFKIHPKSKSPTPKRTSTPRSVRLQKPTQAADNISNKKPQSSRSFHGQYISPEFPNGILSSHHNVDIIAALACYSRAARRHRHTNINNLGWNFYWDYSCDKNQAAFAVVYYYAKKVAARLVGLNQDWKDTELYEQLMEAKFDTSNVPNDHMEKVNALTTGGLKAVHRAQKPRNKSTVQASTSGSASRTVSPNQGQSSVEPSPPIEDLKIDDNVNPPQPSKKRKASPSPPPPTAEIPPEMRGRDLSKFSWSRPSSPAPVEDEKPKVDFYGKPFPKRIKRANYYSFAF